VRKELENSRDYTIELENLAILNLLKHSNIIELLGSYKYEGKFNLIFPLAQGGTLASLLESERQITPFESNETLLVALARLSSAIEHVHNFAHNKLDLHLIGCHHDLRPRNILVCGDRLLLADFGLSQLTDTSKGSKSTFKAGTDYYLAPECEDLDDGFRKSLVGRSSDIWSFGCILAEVLTYLVRGPHGVEQFREERSFEKNGWTLDYFHCGSEPNPRVENWLSGLARESTRTGNILIILIRHMLSLKEADRPKAKEVTATLQLIAIYETAGSIDRMFDLLCKRETSLDISLPLWRYNGWKYGLGILDQDHISSLHDYSSMGPILDFDSTLSCLSEMQDSLTSLSTAEAQSRSPDLRRIAQLNDRLLQLLSTEQQGRARTQFYSAVLGSEDAGALVEKPDSLGILELDRKIRMLASLKSMTLLAEQHTTSNTKGRNFDASLITQLKPFGNHHLGTFTQSGSSHKVLIEWRDYARVGGNKQVDQELFKRLENITNLLSTDKPDDFRSLPCRGFYHDPNRPGFGMVFDLPPRASINEGDCRELQKLIKLTWRNASEQPALEDKFKLAHRLANALLNFHWVGWLHKNLTSSNVAFFREASTPLSALAREPYIIGFNHSRPNDPFAFTAGASESNDGGYHHPEYRRDGARYRPEYDYYSLGIVLLEIGLWTRLKEMTSDWATPSAREFQQKLLDRRVPNVAAYMGTAYREAVRVCIAGDFGLDEFASGDSEAKSALHLRFEKLVVARLRGPWEVA
jgi:serine/threonine protein kinase